MQHRTTTRFRRRAPWLLVVSFLLVAACSSSGDDDAQSSSPDATAASAIDRSGVVKVGFDLLQTNGNPTLDPTLTPVSSAPNDPIWFLVWGRLMRPTADGGLEPELAQSVNLVDTQTIQVELRPGLTWQDGSPFDAAGVKTGLERTLASNTPGALDKNFRTLTSIDVTSPTSLTLHFPTGTAASWLDMFMGSWETTIVKPGTDFNAPIGAGPMKMVSYVPGQTMSLQRWDGYWNADAVSFAGMDLTQLALGEASTSGLAALKAGQLDLAISDVATHDTLSGNLEPITVPDANRFVAMQLCKRDAPLSDARVRIAMSKAIDREALSDAVYSGTAVPATMPWPEGNRFYTDDVADALAYDVDGAKQLLTDAGYADGFTFDLYPINANSLPTAAEVIKEQLAKVGITANIVPVNNYVGEFLQPQKSGGGLTPGGSGGTAKLTQWYGDNLGNVCRYDDSTIAGLAKQLGQVSEQSDEAKQLWDQVNEQFTEQGLSVPLVFSARLAAYNSSRLYVEDIFPKGFSPMPNIYTAYVKAS